MNNIIKRVWIQNRLVNIEDLTGMVFQAEIGAHTFEISGIDDTGAAVALSGTVSGVFRRPDNADIALTGSASDGVVSVTLSEDCYAVPGRFGLTIFVTSNSQKVAVYACVGTVAVSSTGNVAGDTPASVEDLIDDINAAIADLNTAIGSIPADYSQFMAAIAPAYSSSALYAVGSYAWYNGSLYRCTTAITTAEAWTAAHWTAAVLGDDVGELKSAISDGNGNVILSKDLETKVDYVVAENKEQLISSSRFVDTAIGTSVITYSDDGFTSVLSASANRVFGYYFNTVNGASYTLEVDVTEGTVGYIILTHSRSFSTSSYLAKVNDAGVGKHRITFTASSNETTLWFYQAYNMSRIAVSQSFLDFGLAYNNLDEGLASEVKPAQGKAVGDMFQNLPSAQWFDYENVFQIVPADLVTDIVGGGSTIPRVINGNNIHLESNDVNSQTSYIIRGMKAEADYTFEFDFDGTFSSSTVELTIEAYASSLGKTYKQFTANQNHYSCTFRAMDYPIYLAIALSYRSTTFDLKNITIRKAAVEEPCDYSGNGVTSFNKCLCIGDSLTYGGFNATDVDPDVGIGTLAEKYSYPVYFQKLTGIETVKKAIGGLTSVDWYDRYKNDDLSGFDMAIIQLGVNDASPSKLNGWSQASVDAFTNIINKLKTENNGIKIFVATTVPAPAFRSNNIDGVNAGIRDLVDDLDDPDVVLTDINVYGHTGDAIGYDAGHLTAFGYNRLARDYISLISYIMDMNKENYRFIQFIGTNYEYDD